ncbi:MAG: hypothetical protein AB7L09_14950 [Nitrospira sp.]
MARDYTKPIEKICSQDIAPARARELQGTIFLSFKELEVPEEPLHVAPGLLPYILKLHEKIPHLFYFLHSAPTLGAIEFFLRAQFQKLNIAEPTEARLVNLPPRILDVLILHLESSSRFATAKGDDWLSVVESLLTGQDELRLRALSKIQSNLTEPTIK